MKLTKTILFNCSFGLAFILLSSFGNGSKENSKNQTTNLEYFVVGQVTDCATGDPIVGVAVKVQSTSNGTLTNFDGNYAISVPAGSVVTLEFLE